MHGSTQHTFHIRMAPSNPLIMIASGTKSREGKNDLGGTNHQQRSDGRDCACSQLRTEPRRRIIHSSGGRGSLRWWVGSSAQQRQESEEEGFGGDSPSLSCDITRATSRATPRAPRNTQPRVTNQKRNTIGSCTTEPRKSTFACSKHQRKRRFTYVGCRLDTVPGVGRRGTELRMLTNGGRDVVASESCASRGKLSAGDLGSPSWVVEPIVGSSW